MTMLMAARQAAEVVRVEALERSYATTRALCGVSLTLRRGEILGVVGHNGAGKSTLVRLLAGREKPDSGRVVWDGAPGEWNSAVAASFGVRMVYQELALCPDLTVGENAALSDPRRRGFGWRRTAERRITALLDQVFPHHGVEAFRRVGELSMASRQMVEIARALCTDNLSFLILDEPTESLSLDATRGLYAYLKCLAARGISILLISHRMKEVLGNCGRIVVMRDGAVADDVVATEASEERLLTAMGGMSGPAAIAAKWSPPPGPGHARTVLATVELDNGQKVDVRAGEILGLAGLAGQGQEQLLDRIWKSQRFAGKRAYVPGDRQNSGILPLWSVAENLTISALESVSRFGVVRGRAKRELAARWVAKLRVRGGARSPISALSGGNQQKVLVARAFASGAEIILLDDPFRGVDAATKSDLYALMKVESEAGRAIVWYSTETPEMLHCHRVVVLRAGRVVSDLAGPALAEDRIIADSFEEVAL